MNQIRLRMTEQHYALLRSHLFPGDNMEAVAVALCGRGFGLNDEVLLVHKLDLNPHDKCDRRRDRIRWSPTGIERFLRDASEHDMGIVKFHSHPMGGAVFSAADDASDKNLFESVFGWVDSDRPHASVVMLPNGHMFGRRVYPSGVWSALDTIGVVGDDVRFWRSCKDNVIIPAFTARHAQLFGDGTTAILGNLRVAVIGCSGTGSAVVEQLARLGVRELVLVDPDRVEEKNLNRIVGATRQDAEAQALKVDVMARSVKEMGLGTIVHRFPTSVAEPETIRAVSASDFVVGCMDTLHGRHIVSRIARYYLLPYVDVGVKLEALGDGTINQVAGSVHYFRPDGGDFIDRGIFSAQALESDDLFFSSPDDYRERLERGYIRGVAVERPAVVSVNMVFAGLAVNEVLVRLHPFRLDPNSEFATTRLSLSHFQLDQEKDHPAPSRMLRILGRGDTSPLLGMPSVASRNVGSFP